MFPGGKIKLLLNNFAPNGGRKKGLEEERTKQLIVLRIDLFHRLFLISQG